MHYTLRQQEVEVFCLSTVLSVTISVKPHTRGFRWSHSIVLPPLNLPSTLKKCQQIRGTVFISSLRYSIQTQYSSSTLSTKRTPANYYQTVLKNILYHNGVITNVSMCRKKILRLILRK